MKKVLTLVLLISACSPDRKVVQILQGQPGINGQDGTNGTSCSLSEELDGESQVGVRLTCSDGTSLVVHNGADAESVNYAQIMDYSATSCTQIADTLSYMKKSGSNFGLYTASSCHGSTKFAEISQGESYWASGFVLVTIASAVARVITFGAL
jgi:hypothetical protein